MSAVLITERKMLVAQTRDDRYVFTIYSDAGFTVYQLLKRTDHSRRRIRKIARHYGVEIPGRINWDAVPCGDRIEKFDGESEARIIPSPVPTQSELAEAAVSA